MELVYMPTPHYDAGRYFLMNLAKQNDPKHAESFDLNPNKQTKSHLRVAGSCSTKNPASSRSREDAGERGSSSDEEELSPSALSNCINIIENRRLTRDDISTVSQMVNRMVEFASYQAAVSMSPGIITLLENYQERMWASEFDKMDLGSSSYNDVERIGEARPVEDTSNSNKVKKRGEKLQQETRKKSSSHAQRAVKEICEAVGNCSGKDTKSISMAAKAFGAQAHSFKSLDIPTAGGSGLQKTTTNHTKAIGSHETLRASQVTLPLSEDPPHASSNDDDEWPATDFSPPEVCGIRRARLRRRPTSAEKPPQGLRVSGSMKPLHIGDGNHRSSEETVYDEAFLCPNGRSNLQTHRLSSKGTTPRSDYEQIRSSTPNQPRGMYHPSCPSPGPQNITRSNEPLFGKHQSDAERSSSMGSEGCLSTEIASTTAITALQCFERDRSRQGQTPRGECSIPLYSKNGPITLTPRGGVIQGFPARTWLASPGTQELEHPRSTYVISMQKPQRMKSTIGFQEAPITASSRLPKSHGMGSKRKSRRKMKSRHRRTFHRQNSAQKEVVLGLEPVLKDRHVSQSGSPKGSNLLKDQASNAHFQNRIEALSRQTSTPDCKSRPRGEKGPAGQLSSGGIASSSNSMVEALRNQCMRPIPDSLAGGFCSDSCLEHKEKARPRKAPQSRVQPGPRSGSMSQRVTSKEVEKGTFERFKGTSGAPKMQASYKPHKSSKWHNIRMTLDVAVSKRLREITRLHMESSKSDSKGSKTRR